MRTHDISRWAFLPADDANAWAKGYDDSDWRAVTVPHDWSVEREFSPECSSGTGYLPGGVGWYRAHVTISGLGDLRGRHVRLVFAGVYKNARVWVNGYHLGGRPSGHAELSFDLTEILSYAPDDDLVLAVRVDHTDLSDSRWYNGSGITRTVEIQTHAAVRLAGHGARFETLRADAEHATVRTRQQVVNDLDERLRVQVRTALRRTGQDEASSAVEHSAATVAEIAAGESADLAQLIEVPHPALWSDTAPSLYQLTTTLAWEHAGEQASATYTAVVGIRTFAFDADRGFSINGEPRLLKGVCLHEDAGCLGTAVPAAVWLRRLLTLKEMGCNAVRMAHNPHAPELYTLCDALGLFVIDEAFDEWENPKNKWWQGHNVYPPRHEGPAEHFHTWHERDLRSMIEAHAHHPSIIAWSIGNEIDYPNDPYAHPSFGQMTGNNDANKPAAERVHDPDRPDMRRLVSIADRLAEIVRHADPTRPVTIAAAFPELSSRIGLLGCVDLVGYNYKEHLYAADHQRFPDTPFVGSENAHGYAQWRIARDEEYVAGQFLWTGIDYLGEAHGWPVHGSGAGLLTLAGVRKHTWHLRRSWWSDEPVARLATRPQEPDGGSSDFWRRPLSRGWPGDGSEVEVLCFGNRDMALTCGDDPVELSWSEEGGYWHAVLPGGPDPLVLQARDGAGEVVAEDALTVRGDAVRLEAVAWAAPAEAASGCADAGVDLGQVAQIECVLRDAEGRVARDDLLVEVEVTGGELLAIENGDLADTTAYHQPARRTLEGRLLVLVRSTGTADVRLSAAGLAPVTVLGTCAWQ